MEYGQMLDLTHLHLENVTGVGTIELNLEPNKHAYVFIGKNGIGKTRLLSKLYGDFLLALNDKPFVFIKTQDRGTFEETIEKPEQLRDWIIESVALSSIFQKSKNNRQHYLFTLLKCLHEIDHGYDSEFLEVDERNNIFLKINNEEKELSELSTGFVSIIKIIVSILSVYGEETQTKDLQKINGIVLIDEIESHLHLEWQVKIIPLLKKLFPNTIFFIATHSPLVLSQLEDGEAYELRRDEDDVVRTHKIDNPSKVTIVDLLRQAFGIDLNQLKTEQMSAAQQQEVKKALLELLD